MSKSFEFSPLNLLPNIFNIVLEKGTFDKVIHDDVTVGDIYDSLQDTMMIQASINGEFIGFFSLEDLGEFIDRKVVEVHAFILPSHRKHSIEVLKAFRNFIFTETSFETIVTQVPTIYDKSQRVIRWIGFKPFKTDDDVVSFRGELSGMTYFYINKEQIIGG